MRVGLISDTHNLLRPEAKAFLQACDHIIHAGDLCSEALLVELRSIAPVTAVRGNNDKGAWAHALREVELVRLEEAGVCVIHDLACLDMELAAVGVHVVVSGHSHKPVIETRAGMLYVNPGSAGPRRFKLPIAVAELDIQGDQVSARIVEL